MNEQKSLLAAIHEEVKLHPYDPAWPATYDAERQRLLSLLPDTLLDIQHIGSTAVPGLSAKPIIDILAGVQSMAVAESLAVPLCSSGYTTSAEFNQTLSDRKWFMRWADGRRTHHLHVVVHGGQAWHERLRFRDALRTSPDLAARYAALKARSAAAHPVDREAYTDAKTEFVRSAFSGQMTIPSGKDTLSAFARRLRVEPLAHYRGLMPLVTQWLVSEWPDWYGPQGPGNAVQDVATFAASDTALPVGMVIFENHIPVGVGALKASSIPSHAHLSPWAAAGYVLPDCRGRGLGAELLKALVARAQRLGYRRVYCATSTAQRLLHRAGWLPLEVTTLEGKPLTIFQTAA